ncbi:MAG: alpha/beta hydrolase [Myxococcales bacterium]|jgi:pimeloyl-ACP methyl ester carboxylesterase
MKWNAIWMDTVPRLGQAGRVDEARALASRPGLSFMETSAGRVRVRQGSSRSPAGLSVLLAADGPNVIEHYDRLIPALEGRVQWVVFEPPGTGASTPARGFEFTVDAFEKCCTEVLEAVGPRTLVFPCYLGFVGQRIARARPDLVEGLVMPQTPSWSDMERWADQVDPKRLLRTPVVGQLLLALRRRDVAATWYRMSTSDKRFRQPFIDAANEAFDFGACFCLASLMQGYARGPAPASGGIAAPSAVIWGARDRTHRLSDPNQSVPGAHVVTMPECGHSPELEDPEAFVDWLLRWQTGSWPPQG